MSKSQGDSFRTETNYELNKYYDEVFLPTLLKMEDYKETRFHVCDFIIICEQKNIVNRIGYKLKSLEITGTEYTLRVHMDNEFDSKGRSTGLSLSVDTYTNKDDANKRFLQLKEMCK